MVIGLLCHFAFRSNVLVERPLENSVKGRNLPQPHGSVK